MGQWDPGRDALTRESARVGFLRGSIAGDGLRKEWREMGHSVQWTSIYLIAAARRCSAGNKWLQV